MDPGHNFGQIRLHVARALFHLNQLASLIPFCVIDEDAPHPSPPPPSMGYGRSLVRWSEMGPTSPTASSSSRTNLLMTHGQLPPSMILNPESHLRPISFRTHAEAESTTPRGRQSIIRTSHPTDSPTRDSEEPIPMAAPRPAKRPRNTSTSRPSPPERPIHHSVRPEPLPIPDDDDVHITHTTPTHLPLRTEETASDEDRATSAPAALPPDISTDPVPDASEAFPPTPRIGHTIRGWAKIDDDELISLKQDARARHSWKAIGQRLHRDPDSCKARWYWLKSSRPDISAPTAETED